jgi:hypothetical protein
MTSLLLIIALFTKLKLNDLTLFKGYLRNQSLRDTIVRKLDIALSVYKYISTLQIFMKYSLGV